MSSERVVRLLKLLSTAPRTQVELIELSGFGETAVKRLIGLLHREGLVYIARREGLKRVWGWQPTPYQCSDAPPLYTTYRLKVLEKRDLYA